MLVFSLHKLQDGFGHNVRTKEGVRWIPIEFCSGCLIDPSIPQLAGREKHREAANEAKKK